MKSSNNESNSKDTNQVEIVVRSSTSVDWVMEKTSYGSEEYRGELDAIYAKAFVVKGTYGKTVTSGLAPLKKTIRANE